MSRRLRSFVATAFALVSLGVMATVAGAYSLTFEPAGAIELPSTGQVSFEASGIAVRCNLTLSGELESTVEAEPGSTLGAVESVEWSGCSGGGIRSASGFPWDIDLESFSGTLPAEITAVYANIHDMALTFSVFGGFVNCAYRGLMRIRLVPVWIGIIRFAVIEIYLETGLRLTGGGGFCPTSVVTTGTHTVEPEQVMDVS